MTAALEHDPESDARATGSVREPSPDSGLTAGALVLEERFSIVPEWVLDADISDAAVRLYAVLLRYGASSGQRMPSRRTLAARMRKKSVDSVDRALKELVGVGAVEVTRRVRDGVNLTNRYLVRSTRLGGPLPDRPAPLPRGGGGRAAAATPPDPVGQEPARPGGTAVPGRRRRGRGGRRAAATGGRVGAAGVAAPVRPDPEFLTETSPPPGPSSMPSPAGATGRGASGRSARRARVLAVLGVDDLEDVAALCARARAALGRPVTLWTQGRLADVLADAVLDRGWPGDRAVPALLAVAADPATRSPARLSCPGPWWDAPASTDGGGDGAGGVEADEVRDLEAVLAETGGRRVVLQRQAREDLAAEGAPVTRASVARRAVGLLGRHDAGDVPSGSVRPGGMPVGKASGAGDGPP